MIHEPNRRQTVPDNPESLEALERKSQREGPAAYAPQPDELTSSKEESQKHRKNAHKEAPPKDDLGFPASDESKWG